ncbi:uncharacterized protein LOC18442301 isoform X2 [Amborella trichopoda]|uniref:uncharacterized protein LOC18442301 isoform X2 n=1 Tax=Amborella trichopoda TaxID=13333 RepID=UPI0009BFBB4E|nr:uncharacterized protein LOC18442301 isoform X2 [Amborella trichopoda]|eukprot:XP_020527848.1 uncharacterized protein LOC18442301 isoform X2 [Amborella trichopoda]
MGDAQKWNVTYTKHMKQRRKVYQDGALELNSSKNKIMLYDDCGNVVASRFLKNTEVVKSGNTLEFDSYLVDVGEFEQKCKPLSSSNVEERGKKPFRKTLFHGNIPKRDPCPESKERDLHKSGTQFVQNLSYSRPNLLKENKNREVQKTGASLQNISNSTPNVSKEWCALYTQQKTQKTKKYQDGFVRLDNVGSFRKQVILLNEEGTVLESKYVAFSENVCTGSTYEFPRYMVELGEPRTSQAGEPPSQKKSCSRSMGANVYKFKNSEVVSNCNMVRDAHQILSVLKKPVDQANHSRLSVERNLSNCESSSLSPSLAQEKLLKHGTLISSYQECPEKINTNGLPILEAGDVKKCDISGSYQSPKNSEDPKKFSSVNSVNLVDDSLGIRGRLADNSDITSRKPLSSTCVPWRLASAVEVGANIKQETVSHTGHASEVIGTTHENKVHESGALFDLKEASTPVNHVPADESQRLGSNASTLSGLTSLNYMKEENSVQRNCTGDANSLPKSLASTCSTISEIQCKPPLPVVSSLERDGPNRFKSLSENMDMDECPSFDLGL